MHYITFMAGSSFLNFLDIFATKFLMNCLNKGSFKDFLLVGKTAKKVVHFLRYEYDKRQNLRGTDKVRSLF